MGVGLAYKVRKNSTLGNSEDQWVLSKVGLPDVNLCSAILLYNAATYFNFAGPQFGVYKLGRVLMVRRIIFPIGT